MEKTIEERLATLANYLYIGGEISLWGFGEDGELYYSTCPYEKDMLLFFKDRGCLAYALGRKEADTVPFIMSDKMGLLWVGEFADLSGSKMRMLVVLGPFFDRAMSVEEIDKGLRKVDAPLPTRGRFRDILQKLPVLPAGIMNQYIRMLHYGITDETIEQGKFVFQSLDPAGNPQEDSEENRERLEHHFTEYERALCREGIIAQCIREGNLNYREIVDEENKWALPLDLDLGDPVREAKDTVLLFSDLCCRSAIEGKLPVKTAKEIQRKYIRRIERCSTISELMKTNRDLLEEYVISVYEFISRDNTVSVPIRTCCDYIRSHFMEELDLKTIAKNIGYTEYYLSRKFQKEMGMKIWDYIKSVRLEYAKVWLVTTEKSIQEISEKMQFGTRNYFSRVFRDKEGMTPQEYRERARSIGRTERVENKS